MSIVPAATIPARHRLADLGLTAQAAAAIEKPNEAAPAPAEGPADLIRKLAELRDAGILTQKEFEAKKAELLFRM